MNPKIEVTHVGERTNCRRNSRVTMSDSHMYIFYPLPLEGIRFGVEAEPGKGYLYVRHVYGRVLEVALCLFHGFYWLLHQIGEKVTEWELIPTDGG